MWEALKTIWSYLEEEHLMRVTSWRKCKSIKRIISTWNSFSDWLFKNSSRIWTASSVKFPPDSLQWIKAPAYLEASRQVQVFQFLTALSSRQVLQSAVRELLTVAQTQELDIVAVPGQRGKWGHFSGWRNVVISLDGDTGTQCFKYIHTIR